METAKLLLVMLRPFQLRDANLLYRLSRQGIPLHVELALTRNPNPLRGALHNLLTGGDFPTYIWKAEEREVCGFAQVARQADGVKAHLLYVGSAESTSTAAPNDPPAPFIDEDAWLSLLDELTAVLGALGVQNIIAEVDEHGPELPILRRAGFVIYTRQDIWIRQYVSPSGNKPVDLTDYTSEYAWDVQLLYAHTVPNMIQLVEPHPPVGRYSWVRYAGQELAAYIHIETGREAEWLHLFMHPNAQTQADQIVAAVLSHRPPAREYALYCGLRRYQNWLQGALQRNGFEYWGSQAMLVRHTTHHARKLSPSLEAELRLDRAIARPTSLIRQAPYG